MRKLVLALSALLLLITPALAREPEEAAMPDFGAQALAFAKDLLTFVTAGLPIVLMLFWKGRGY